MENGELTAKEESGAEWFAVYTRARHEQKVAEQITKLGYQSFLPRFQALSKRKDRRKLIQSPIFPGYIFARVPSNDFNKLLKLPGVVKILGEKGKPAPIPAEELESVKILLESESVIEPHPYLRAGDKVKIVSGPLKGAVGWLLRVETSISLLVVSVNILNRSIAVELSDEVVEKY